VGTDEVGLSNFPQSTFCDGPGNQAFCEGERLGGLLYRSHSLQPLSWRFWVPDQSGKGGGGVRSRTGWKDLIPAVA
jgi:hypothetical protein